MSAAAEPGSHRTPAAVTIVVPTVGRPSLERLVHSLAVADGPAPDAVVLVDDRRDTTTPLLAASPPGWLDGRLRIVRSGGRGPAAARNAGWQATTTSWVAFLDDDVEVTADWLATLHADLTVSADIAASQATVVVPLPAHRRPTDWERNVAGLEHARWATADMAYRRSALIAVGGFDERFPRAYREDADLGLRVVDRGWRIVRGARTVRHPVRPADRWISVRLQRGNADDALMRARHGPGWRARAGVPRGRRPQHLALVGLTAAALLAALRGRRRTARTALAAGLALTCRFAWERIAPGPRTADEIATMVVTSAVIPFAAAWQWVRGWLGVLRDGAAPPDTAAVLFDRDGTLVVDVPYNGDPDRVRVREGAHAAVTALREAGVPTAVVSNQSGIGRGLLTGAQVAAVNRRIEQVLGPLGPWCICPHGPHDGCGCRKPAPGLILQAADRLGVDVARCVVIGDIGSDIAAARRAGATAVLVPTDVTRPEEIAAAHLVADTLPEAVELALGHRP